MFATAKELFATENIFATAKESFAFAKLKPRMIATSGSPRQRLLLTVAKVKARYGKEKDD